MDKARSVILPSTIISRDLVAMCQHFTAHQDAPLVTLSLPQAKQLVGAKIQSCVESHALWNKVKTDWHLTIEQYLPWYQSGFNRNALSQAFEDFVLSELEVGIGHLVHCIIGGPNWDYWEVVHTPHADVVLNYVGDYRVLEWHRLTNTPLR